MTDAVPFPAAIPLQDYSMLIGTTSVLVLPPGVLKSGVRYVHFYNGSSTNSWIWYSYTGPAAINAPGSYPLPPGGEVKWCDDVIPANPLYAVATSANTLLTVMIG